MPDYIYKCADCGKTMTENFRADDPDIEIPMECSDCGGEMLLQRNVAIVSTKELGHLCWLPNRFLKGGGRCERVFSCAYPEKASCQAVHAEIVELEHKAERYSHNIIQIGRTIRDLEKNYKK